MNEDAMKAVEQYLGRVRIYLPLGSEEALAEIKAQDDLKRIPVVVLTTSRDEEDVLKTYDLHANCFITKPVDLQQFINVVRSVEEFWLTVVKLPPH